MSPQSPDRIRIEIIPVSGKPRTYTFRVYIDGKPAETPWRVKWEFGDGNSSLQYSPTHTYQEDNAYEVQVTAELLDPKDPGPGKEKEKLVSQTKIPSSPSLANSKENLGRLSQLKQAPQKPSSQSQSHAQGKSKSDRKA